MKRLLKMSSAPRTILSRIPASPISKSTKPTHSMDMLSVDHPTFTITAHGIFARMPIIKHSGFVIAVMDWSRGGQRLGLLLSPSPRSADSTYPSFDMGDIGPFGRDNPCRTIPLGRRKEQHIRALWENCRSPVEGSLPCTSSSARCGVRTRATAADHPWILRSIPYTPATHRRLSTRPPTEQPSPSSLDFIAASAVERHPSRRPQFRRTRI